MGTNTKYGFCRGECGRWVPRDEMLSINATIYDADNAEERVPLRLCTLCHEKEKDRLARMRWDNALKTELEIQTNPELARESDLEFDDSEVVMRAAGLI